MKQAQIFIRDRFAGLLTEDDNGYSFCYDNEYLQTKDVEVVSLTMPLRKEAYHSRVLFPCFDGLIPEGWLLEIAGRSWKIDRRDRMSLLLACCKDCIGAVSVVPLKKEK
jgi:serine/threonine-protein kinase HipA